jgi:hypothetical protein
MPSFRCTESENERCTCGLGDCEKSGKHPLIRDWPKEATRDPEKIEQWLTQWRFANIGVVTGANNRLVVLDRQQIRGK